MLKFVIALALMILASGQARSTVLGQEPSSDEAAVMVPIRQFVDGFNKGDTETALAACDDEGSIIDEFPPHEWNGEGACAKWMDDYVSDAEKNGITEGIVTLGTPKHVDITEDHAYVVIPSDYTFKKDGETVQEIGALFTFALQRGDAGWRISGWSWARN